MVSIVAAVVLVLQHQAMSMQNTDLHYKKWLVHSKVNALDCDAASFTTSILFCESCWKEEIVNKWFYISLMTLKPGQTVQP